MWYHSTNTIRLPIQNQAHNQAPSHQPVEQIIPDQATIEATAKADWKTYRSETKKFEVRYPSQFKIYFEDEIDTLFEAREENFRPHNLGISVLDIDKPFSEWMQPVLDCEPGDGIGFLCATKERVEVAHEEGIEVKSCGPQFCMLEVWIAKDRRVYQIVPSPNEAQTTQERDTIERIFSSFTFLE